jgi:hypothetical protein
MMELRTRTRKCEMVESDRGKWSHCTATSGWRLRVLMDTVRTTTSFFASALSSGGTRFTAQIESSSVPSEKPVRA